MSGNGPLGRAVGRALVAVAAGGLTATSLAAPTAGVTADERASTEQLKSLADPTILRSQVLLDSEWNELEQGEGDGKLMPGGQWARAVSPNRDWAVGLKVPFAWHVAGEASGDSDEHGLGDLDLGTAAAFRLNESWRTGGGVQLRARSATGDELGDGAWRLKPSWAVAWDATERLTFAPSAQYIHTFAEKDGVAPKRYMEVFVPAMYLLPHRWLLAGQYEAKVDFENDGRWTHSAKVFVAKGLARAPVKLLASIKKSFDGGAKKFQLNFVATYYFN